MNRPMYRMTCRTCERPRGDGERFSWTGQCPECGINALAENLKGLTTHSGPAYHRYAAAMARRSLAMLEEARSAR